MPDFGLNSELCAIVSIVNVRSLFSGGDYLEGYVRVFFFVRSEKCLRLLFE